MIRKYKTQKACVLSVLASSSRKHFFRSLLWTYSLWYFQGKVPLPVNGARVFPQISTPLARVGAVVFQWTDLPMGKRHCSKMTSRIPLPEWSFPGKLAGQSHLNYCIIVNKVYLKISQFSVPRASTFVILTFHFQTTNVACNSCVLEHLK